LNTLHLNSIKNMKKYPSVLSIAGSDSGGGAGIQADIKAISACGAFATTAITAVTSQNTLGVQAIHPIPVQHLSSQIQSVLSDIHIDAIKIGMLHSAEVIQTVVDKIKLYNIPHIILDPVMVATSGDRLLQEEAIESLKKIAIPIATVITPNVQEAEILMSEIYHTSEDFKDFGIRLSERFKTSVLLKAGHLKGENSVDYLINYTNQTITELPSKRVPTNNTHGTGCTLSSALAAFLAQGFSLEESALIAKKYIYTAIQLGADYQTGKGNGPVNHFLNQVVTNDLL